MARSLSAILPAWAPTPARITELDGMYATAAGLDGYTRVGALGRLDVDALRAALMRILPSRAIVISTEEQSLTCYERAKVVCSSPVTAGSATPTGIFHIQVKQASISTLYWNRTGDSFQYRPGFLPDWMALSQSAADPGSSGMALQGAPWRAVFGLGSDVWDPAYAPSTPGSIDLPPGTAAFIFRWAPIGTEVVVY
jgi:lipoprotein-anchoring transpeptidase ErfK/SrfK